MISFFSIDRSCSLLNCRREIESVSGHINVELAAWCNNFLASFYTPSRLSSLSLYLLILDLYTRPLSLSLSPSLSLSDSSLSLSLPPPLPLFKSLSFSLSLSLSLVPLLWFSLSVSLSLVSLSLTHRKYLTHKIGSASALPNMKRGSASYIVPEVLLVRERERYREREREIDGSDVTIVALKLAMNLHFLLPKIAQLAMSLHIPLQKVRTFRFSLHDHTSRLSFHGEVTMVAVKFAMSSHFQYCQKNFCPQALFPLFQMARAARRVFENPRQMIKSCPVLFCSSHRKTKSN